MVTQARPAPAAANAPGGSLSTVRSADKREGLIW